MKTSLRLKALGFPENSIKKGDALEDLAEEMASPLMEKAFDQIIDALNHQIQKKAETDSKIFDKSYYNRLIHILFDRLTLKIDLTFEVPEALIQEFEFETISSYEIGLSITEFMKHRKE